MTDVIVLAPDATDVVVPTPSSTSVEVIDGAVHVHHHYDGGGGSSAFELRGTGMPSGTVTADPGTYYTDTAGTNGAWRWLKKTGTGNTGWECIVGDTGPRNVTSLHANNPRFHWADGNFIVRRAGQMCTLTVLAYANASYLSSGSVALTLPEGMRPLAETLSPVPALVNHIQVWVDGALMIMGPLGDWGDVTGAITYSTNDPWPTTLPGVPG